MADVTIHRTVSEQNQHDVTAPFLGGGHDMGRVSNHSVLLFGLRIKQDPGLVLDVKDPELAGHIPCGVNLSSIHVDFSLEKRKQKEEKRKYEKDINVPEMIQLRFAKFSPDLN